MKIRIIILLLILLKLSNSFAGEAVDSFIDTAQYDDGDKIPYLQTAVGSTLPKYVLIMMPGGNGIMNIKKNADETIYFQSGGNFLIRSRGLFADDEFRTISIDGDRSIKRMRIVIADLKLKFPNAKIYIVGTSRSTLATMHQSENMDGEVNGFIHTASMGSISGLDTRKSKSKNLIVAHKNDGCRLTPASSSIENHDTYGTDLILMEGGISEGDPCQAFGHHGFNGIEKETIRNIKAWIKKS
ncbi:hypothetical protein [Polynucleobacter brandtiae]|uniref:Alpha/beta hydrolase n=1 Tax=Polynucleobacter brandtiae TaxID=1938816 RepID=A0A2M8VYY7_9BURK|nr:hypothetical protein [Polynucleobacter brandtiae]PJI83068.1 hypothetical protein B0G85_0458 [Polynucleobacter brandtiae]